MDLLSKNLDYDLISNSNVELNVFATDISTGKVALFNKSHMSANNFEEMIFASAALAPVFKPLKINGSYYIDGGLMSNLPVAQAIADGHDTIYIIFLDTQKTYGIESFNSKRDKGFAIFSMLTQKLRIASSWLNELETTCQLNPQISIKGFFASTDQGSIIDFSKKTNNERIKNG